MNQIRYDPDLGYQIYVIRDNGSSYWRRASAYNAIRYALQHGLEFPKESPDSDIENFNKANNVRQTN